MSEAKLGSSDHSRRTARLREDLSCLETVYNTAKDIVQIIHEGMQRVAPGQLSTERSDDKGRTWAVTINDAEHPTSAYGRTLDGTPVPGFRDVPDGSFQTTAISMHSCIVWHKERTRKQPETTDPQATGAGIMELAHALFTQSSSEPSVTS